MKTIKYISMILGLLVMSITQNYLSAQEYDDLYYDPNDDSSKETLKEGEEQQRAKSDYELYREALEKEAMERKSDSAIADKDLEYDQDKEYLDENYMDNEGYQDDYYQGSSTVHHYYHYDNCYSCGRYGYYDWDPFWSFGFSWGYPYYGWGISYGYPYYRYSYYPYNFYSPYHYWGWYDPYPYYYGSYYNGYWDGYYRGYYGNYYRSSRYYGNVYYGRRYARSSNTYYTPRSRSGYVTTSTGTSRSTPYYNSRTSSGSRSVTNRSATDSRSRSVTTHTSTSRSNTYTNTRTAPATRTTTTGRSSNGGNIQNTYRSTTRPAPQQGPSSSSSYPDSS